MAHFSESAFMINDLAIGARVLLSLCVAVLINACGAMSPKEAPGVSTPPAGNTAGVALGDDEVLSRLGTLPSQQLATGECGLFLWAKREDAPLVFFQRSTGPAFMDVDGSFSELMRTNAENAIGLQFHQLQHFTAADMQIRVSITPEETQSLQRGLKLPSGSISVVTGDGWSVSIPVAGAIGCR